ncbi:MAG: DMT family transporter, partial [Pseudomonadota bacterium]|nr:DMT family transporter [Pseudomonadota bacterium]
MNTSPIDPHVIAEEARRQRLIGYGLLFATLLIWGSFTLLSRLATTQALTPWDISGLRFAAAIAVLLPIQYYRGELRQLLNWRLFGLAWMGGLCYATLAYLGFDYAPAAHAAIWLNGMLPFWTAIAAFVVLGEAFSQDIQISLLVIAFGLLGMAGFMLLEQSFYWSIGDLFFLMAAGFWGFYSAFLKKWSFPPWTAMSAVAIWSAILYLPIYLLFLPKGLAEASWTQILVQSVFLGWFVVILALLTYICGIQRLGAFKVGSLLALAPLLAALAAVPLLNEPLTPALMIGLVAVSIGALQPWRMWRRNSATPETT